MSTIEEEESSQQWDDQNNFKEEAHDIDYRMSGMMNDLIEDIW